MQQISGTTNPVSEFNGILLDMDGTLVDSTSVVEQILGEFAQEFGLDLDYVYSQAHGMQTIDQIRFFLPQSSPEEQVRIEADMDLKEITRTAGIVEIPGAADFVSELIAMEVPLAVVTSASRAVATARMHAAGIPIPALMITADECSNGKPLPDPYLMGADLIGIQIERCVAFEDAEAGLTSAVTSGAQTIVVGSYTSELAETVTRLTDYRGVSVVPTAGGFRLIVA